MRAFLDELKAAVSGLARAPAFTALAVGVLGLGLGAVIFMYGVANTLMIRPAPYPDGDRLYSVITLDAQVAGDYDEHLKLEDSLLVREAMGSQFEAVGSMYQGTAYLTGDGQAERYDGGFTDGQLFEVTGVAPELGRAILPRDVSPGASPVVVLGHDLWTERFDADPAVLGQVVRVNGRSSEIVGVMPKGFQFPANAQLWVANQEDAATTPRIDQSDVAVYGRLRADGDLDLAQQALAPVAVHIKSRVPKDVFDGRFELIPFQAGFMGDDGAQLIWTLVVAVGFVLLIACANVSNLLLARSAYRVRETTVRSALGATRGRLVVHMLAEGLVISVLATLLGMLLASIALDAMRLAVERMFDDTPHWWTFEMDFRVVGIAVLAAFLSTLVAGLPAAWRASRPSIDSLLRDGGRTGTGLAIGKIAWGLVVFEVALACLLLGVSALLTKSVLTATSGEVGVETGDIMTARVGLVAGTYPEEPGVARFWDTLVRRTQAQPGIDAATVTSALPGNGTGEGPLTIEGRDYGDASTKPVVQSVVVHPTFFDTFRVPLQQGRLPDDRDQLESSHVVVINEAMAKELFAAQSPIGQRVRYDFKGLDRWDTIVGVVPNVVHDNSGTIEPTLYEPVAQAPARFMSIAVRGDGEVRALAGAIRTALTETDPDLALYWVRTLDEARAMQNAGFRLIGTMFAAFAGVALVLAAAGLFGVLAFHVGQRTREIGVRRALGADDGRILKMIMKASGLQVGLGILIGMLLLPVMGSSLGDILGDVSPFDPAIYTMVLSLMVVIAILATLTPTRRALKVDPAAALRYE